MIKHMLSLVQVSSWLHAALPMNFEYFLRCSHRAQPQQGTAEQDGGTGGGGQQPPG